jgi:hypothetical protein
MRSVRFPSLAAVVAAAGIGLAGCASSPPATEAESSPPAAESSGRSGAAATIQQAAQRTESEQTARIRLEAAISANDQEMTTTGEAIVDFDNGAAEGSITADVSGQTQTMSIRQVDGTTYLQMPAVADKWITSPTAIPGITDTDPATLFQNFDNVADFAEVGPEDVEGVATTHYSGSLDLASALSASGLSGADKKQAEQELAKVKGKAPIDVWVDDEGRIIKLVQSVTVDNGDGGLATQSSSVLFTDFGVAVDVSAPDPADIVDPGQLGSDLGAPPGN